VDANVVMTYSQAIVELRVGDKYAGSWTMSRFFQLIYGVGALLLIAIVIMAILALTGQFEPTFTNPPT